MTMEERKAELIADMEEHMVACLVSVTNISKQDARMAARQVAAHLTKHWGGQILYFPKNHLGRLSGRDAEIWRKFNGRNHAELAREYNLTVQQIYKIVREAQALHRKKTQADMFA